MMFNYVTKKRAKCGGKREISHKIGYNWLVILSKNRISVMLLITWR